MIFAAPHPHLEAHKERLLARRVRHFDESNWWQWGRMHHVSDGPRIYVNAKTRRPQPFFLHDSTHYDGSILALFPRVKDLPVSIAVNMLNEQVDWNELGFVCDGRFLFNQRALQNCLLPAEFEQFLDFSRGRRKPVARDIAA